MAVKEYFYFNRTQLLSFALLCMAYEEDAGEKADDNGTHEIASFV